MHIIITCVKRISGNHANPYTSIVNFGWADEEPNGESGIITRDRMYEFVTDGGKAFVIGPKKEKIFLVAGMTEDGTKYVSTDAAKIEDDPLLLIKECN